MNMNARALAAVLANAAFARGECLVQPDADGVLTIPDTWTSIPESAFQWCKDLKKVVIPEKITAIHDAAFYIATILEVVEFEAGSRLVTIGDYAFAYISITSIVIPKGVTKIFRMAFGYAPLEAVEFEAGSQLVTIGAGAFYGTRIKSIAIPKDVVLFGSDVFTDTPCPDTTVFRPGNTVVDCQIVPTTSVPTTAPPLCRGLARNRCRRRDRCNWDPVNNRKVCVPRREHDCTQHATAKRCRQAAAGGCLFESADRRCRHRCTGETKKGTCKKIKNKNGKKNICHFRNQKNPCFRCHARSVCGGAEDDA